MLDSRIATWRHRAGHDECERMSARHSGGPSCARVARKAISYHFSPNAPTVDAWQMMPSWEGVIISDKQVNKIAGFSLHAGVPVEAHLIELTGMVCPIRDQAIAIRQNRAFTLHTFPTYLYTIRRQIQRCFRKYK